MKIAVRQRVYYNVCKNFWKKKNWELKQLEAQIKQKTYPRFLHVSSMLNGMSMILGSHPKAHTP